MTLWRFLRSKLRQELAEEVQCTSALRAWFKYFDKDQSYRIDFKEFEKGLKEMSFAGSKEEVVKMWQELDHDGSGQIDFEEFGGHEEAALWSNFRHFAGSSFHSAKDMIKQLKEHAAEKVDGNEEVDILSQSHMITYIYMSNRQNVR